MEKVVAKKDSSKTSEDRLSERETIELRFDDISLPPVITGGSRRC